MKIDFALILAAGAGTRMGAIGQSLPKVIWPVFEKSVLELEVLYARKIGAQKIYINLHYHQEKILEFIQTNPTFKGVEVLIEKDPIDIGGAVHNLAREVDYEGNLLILNSDQFIFMEEDMLARAWRRFESLDILLFAHYVNSSGLYNGLQMEGDRLVGIVQNDQFPRNLEILTYTGMSLIKLKSLSKISGKSSFFESVANPNESVVGCENILTSPYWDFGTLKRYWKSCFKILECLELGKKDLFIEFLIQTKALDPGKARKTSYDSKGENVINLQEGQSASRLKNKIILSRDVSTPSLLDDSPQLVFNEIVADI